MPHVSVFVLDKVGSVGGIWRCCFVWVLGGLYFG